MAVLDTLPQTRPISDLRTKLSDIEQSAKETGEPIVLIRNGSPSLVVFNADAYNQMVQEQRLTDKLREAEIEEKYRRDSYSLADSKERISRIAEMARAMNA